MRVQHVVVDHVKNLLWSIQFEQVDATIACGGNLTENLKYLVRSMLILACVHTSTR